MMACDYQAKDPNMNHVFTLEGVRLCDNYRCGNNSGDKLSLELEENPVGFCNSNSFVKRESSLVHEVVSAQPELVREVVSTQPGGF
jgi:hypothetical protein